MSSSPPPPPPPPPPARDPHYRKCKRTASYRDSGGAAPKPDGRPKRRPPAAAAASSLPLSSPPICPPLPLSPVARLVPLPLAAVAAPLALVNVPLPPQYANPAGMPIFIKMLTGRTLTLHVDVHDTVRMLTEHIQRNAGIPPCMQQLIHAGLRMDELMRTLGSYSVQKEHTVHCVLNLRGD